VLRIVARTQRDEEFSMARVRGTAQRDSLRGTSGRDNINSARGNDNVHARQGDDKINGGPDRDKLYGQAGNDNIKGGAGNDRLVGGPGDDHLTGGRGNDKLFGGAGADTAHFSGNLADYNFLPTTGGYQVIHARGTQSDGTDFLATDIESLQFADVTVPAGGVTSPPVAGDDTGSTNEATVLNGSSVLANDFDFQALIGTETLSVSAVNGVPGNVGTQITLPSGALLTVNSNGTYTYDPNGQFNDLGPGQTATDSFQYTVSDGNGGTDTATATITIQGQNTAPDLDAGSTAAFEVGSVVATQVDTTIEITDPDDVNMVGGSVAITDGFQTGDTLNFTNQNGITGSYNATTGVLTLTGVSSTENYETAMESVTFSPGGGLAAVLGEREFTFVVSDGDASSAPDVTSTAVINVVDDII
jgi:hypothetical protein